MHAYWLRYTCAICTCLRELSVGRVSYNGCTLVVWENPWYKTSGTALQTIYGVDLILNYKIAIHCKQKVSLQINIMHIHLYL